MFRRTPALALVLALSVALPVTSCSGGDAPTRENAVEAFAEPVTVENCGRTAVFDAPPQRIVSMNDHVTETLIQMGVGDRIVGMGYGASTDVLPEVADEFAQIPALADEYPTAEQIIDLEPDLVVGGMRSAFEAKDGRDRDVLEEKGIGTFLFSEYCGEGFGDVQMLTDDFTQLGELLGEQEGAAALTDRITGELDALSKRLADAGATPVRTFFYDSGEAAPTAVGGIGAGQLIAEYAGAENITSDGEKPYFTTSWEVIGEAAPEAVVVLDYGSTTAEAKIDYLRRHPIMATTPAIVDDRIVVVPLADFFESSRLVSAAETIARALHPQAFED